MSAKTSPSNSRDANVSAGAAGVVPPNVASGVVQIKKELPSDEIKEFAQHTMNELLGWYGFDGVDVDRLDLTAKTSRLLQSAAAAAAHQQQQQQQQQQHLRNSHLRSSRSYHNNNNNSSNNNNNNSSSNNNYNSSSSNSNGNGNGNNNNRKPSNLNCHSNTTTPSDHDTRSSREDDSKSPHSIGKPAGTALMTSHTEEKIDFSNCCWCHRPIAENAPDYLTSTDGPRYCSESCFTQSRRASFKKAKTCDWCKHVRHAVSYVDFQDGASQLQFCSEKCLNQYKMQIFCNETQAHLDMNPHLREQGLEAAAAGDGAGLITPDLWLRNCRSRSASPASTISVSPGPTTVASKRSSPCLTPPQHPSKPLISVAPVSKLLAQKCSSSVVPAAPPPPPPQRHHMHPAPKSGRRKRPHRAAASGGGCGTETVAAILQKQQQLQQQQQQQQPATLSAEFAVSSVPLPPLSPMQESHAQPQPHSTAQPAQQLPQPQLPQLGRPPTSIPASYFATPPNGLMGHPFGARPGPPPPPHPFLPPPPGMLPRGFAAHFAPHPHQATPPQPMPSLQQPQLPELQGALGAILGAAPPVTVMVPYPIIIPLPIPIPVPLPIVDFYKAHLTPEQRKRYDEERSAAAAGRQEEQPQPLDCSKAKSELELEQEQDEEMKQAEQQAMPEQEQDEQQQEPDSVEEQQQQPDSVEELEQELKSIPKTTPSPSTCNSPATDSTGTGREEATHCIVVHNVEPADSNDNATACSEKLPKIKITRLQTKRTLIQTKDAAAATATPTSPAGSSNSSSATTAAECSRPLRKRKRIIDCDFQKIALRDLEAIDTHKQSNNNSSSNGNKEEEDEEDVCNMNGNNNSAKATKK